MVTLTEYNEVCEENKILKAERDRYKKALELIIIGIEIFQSSAQTIAKRALDEKDG